MNCPKCGTVVAPGAPFCPVCNEPLYQQPPAYGPQGYGQPSQPPAYGPQGFQQSYANYQAGSYPPGTQAPYVYGQPVKPKRPSLVGVLCDLPHVFLDSFSKPVEVLRTLMERRDLLTAPLVAGIVLVLSFLCGMVVLRGLIGSLFSAIATLTGASLAQSASSMNQGISYVAGRVAPAVGGIAALCQMLAIVLPLGVYMTYLCAIRKLRFSWELLAGFAAVTTLPSVAAVLLAMALALLSPYLALFPLLCGVVVSQVQACGMVAALIAEPEERLLRVRMALVCLSLVLTGALCGAVGGALMGGVVNRVLLLMASVSSLIG